MPTTAAAAAEARPVVELIPLRQLEEAPFNPRKTFDQQALEELAEDLRLRGVLQPVLARPHGKRYQLVFGARRFRAAQLAGLDAIPVMVRELSDAEALEIAIIENSQRADVHPLEEADGYRELHEKHGYSAEDIAAKVGKSKAFVYARMKLCTLAEPARAAFLEGKLSASIALLVARIPTEELQERATEAILGPSLRDQEPFSLREAAELIQDQFMLRLEGAPFDTKSASLVVAAGPCTTCPKRTGAQPELFSDIQSADVCTDPLCFRRKLQAHTSLKVEEARGKGLQVLEGKKAEEALSYASKHVRMNEVCYEDPKHRTWGEVLKKQDVRPTAVAIDSRGALQELVQKSEAVKALEEAGIRPRHERAAGGASEEEKKRKEALKLRKGAAQLALQEVTVALLSSKPESTWHLVAELVLQHASWEARRLTVARRGLVQPKTGHDPVEAALKEAIAASSVPDVVGLVVELLVCDSAAGSEWNSHYGESLKQACKALNVDLKALERQVKAEGKERAKAKGKGKKPARKAERAGG